MSGAGSFKFNCTFSSFRTDAADSPANAGSSALATGLVLAVLHRGRLFRRGQDEGQAKERIRPYVWRRASAALEALNRPGTPRSERS